MVRVDHSLETKAVIVIKIVIMNRSVSQIVKALFTITAKQSTKVSSCAHTLTACYLSYLSDRLQLKSLQATSWRQFDDNMLNQQQTTIVM